MKKASREILERTLDVDDGNPQMSCRYRGGCLRVIVSFAFSFLEYTLGHMWFKKDGPWYTGASPSKTSSKPSETKGKKDFEAYFEKSQMA